jgi:RNA polymerase sigma factor (sigma-70 family)
MRTAQLNDQEFVKSYLKGDESAFEVLLARHKTRVYSYIYNLVKDRDLTEDIFQDTFVKVIHTLKRGRYNEEGKFLPWVLRIAHNLIIDHFRKNAKMPMVGQKRTQNEDEDFDIFSILKVNQESVQDKMVKTQVMKDLRKLVDTLPHEQREVVIMRHYLDMSFKEISDSTGVSINTSLGRMRYALINLRKLIQKKGVLVEL